MHLYDTEKIMTKRLYTYIRFSDLLNNTMLSAASNWCAQPKRITVPVGKQADDNKTQRPCSKQV